jgi:hypothetical protein
MNPFVLTRIDLFDHLVPETQHTAILSQVIELRPVNDQLLPVLARRPGLWAPGPTLDSPGRLSRSSMQAASALCGHASS